MWSKVDKVDKVDELYLKDRQIFLLVPLMVHNQIWPLEMFERWDNLKHWQFCLFLSLGAKSKKCSELEKLWLLENDPSICNKHLDDRHTSRGSFSHTFIYALPYCQMGKLQLKLFLGTRIAQVQQPSYVYICIHFYKAAIKTITTVLNRHNFGGI